LTERSGDNITQLNRKSIKVAKELLNSVSSGEVMGIVIAGFKTDGTVVTGWGDVDCCQHQTLIGHLQVDLINRFIKANYVTPE
jgi:hypothetical protein